MKKKLPPFDKYAYYLNSVQDPPHTADFLERAYREANGREAHRLREDFCGTFALCCEWVGRDRKNRAVGVDLDEEPIRYGTRHYWPELESDARARLRILQKDVRDPALPTADVVAALNFSFYVLKERSALLTYFRNVRRRLAPGGIFVVDCFGGSETQGPIEDVTEYDDFTYYWDQRGFDPVNHHALFYIHYRRKGERKRERVFRYDWRMWTIPEVKDLLSDAGFRSHRVYWEGTNAKGEGNGRYYQVKGTEESCEAWVAYVVGVK